MIATLDPKTRMGGFPLPGHAPRPKEFREPMPHEIDLPHPAIEELPEFVTRIDGTALAHGVRHYNGSICRHRGQIFMAYRVESFRGVSRVAVCELDSLYRPIRNVVLEPSLTDPRTNIEDPHMGSVNGRLIVFVAEVVRDFPPVCRQRLFELDPGTLQVSSEARMAYGHVNGGAEKNWTPFQLPNGRLGIVYKQSPRTIIDAETSEGWVMPGADMKPPGEFCSLSGRTGPVRISEGSYLEFVGGHVKMKYRGTRYWFGALVFEAKPPFKVVAFTKQPLVWASEASPTIYNPLPGGGHPVCILPAGAMIDGDSVVVSCGVNDSYIALLRFGIDDLLGRMVS